MKTNLKKILSVFLLTVLLVGCGTRLTKGEPVMAPHASDAPAAVTEPDPGTPEEPTALPTEEDDSLRVKVTEDYRWEYAEDGQLLLSYRNAIPEVTLPDEIAADKLNAFLRQRGAEFEYGQITTEPDMSYSGMLSAASEEYGYGLSQGGDEFWFSPYALERKVEIGRGEGVLSLIYSDYTNSNGAHGYTNVFGLNFDTVTGDEITLPSLSNRADFLFFCTEQILRETQLEPEKYYEGYESMVPELLEGNTWYFTQEGLVIVANAYVIAPYAAGTLTFLIPYSALDGWLKEEYMPRERSGGHVVCGFSDDAEEPEIVYDSTDGQGQLIRMTACGNISDVSVIHIKYLEYINDFESNGAVFYISEMSDGDSVCLRTWIPDTIPNLALQYRSENGEMTTQFFTQSGKDGSLIMLSGYE